MPPPKRKKSPASPARGNPRRPPSARRQRERRALVIRLVATATVLLFGGALLYSAASSSSSPGRSPSPTPTSVTKTPAAAAGQCWSDTAAGDPPIGGTMAATAARPGNYSPSGRIPSDAELVKALHQGFIVLWYRPDLSPTERRQLNGLSDSFGRALILVPRASMKSKVVLSAWQRRLTCGEVNLAASTRFVKDNTDKAPEKGFV